MAMWSPPSKVDAELKQQLFDFQSVELPPGANATLRFNLPADPAAIATVTLGGDRVFFPGEYRVTFTRGHGSNLSMPVSVTDHVVLSEFPSPFVDQHEVTVDACLEGTTDVIPHIEAFVTAYKHWSWEASASQLVHTSSKMCLAYDTENGFAHLANCTAAPKWTAAGGLLRPAAAATLCLQTAAKNATMLRVNVTVGSAGCTANAAGWVMPDASVRDGRRPRNFAAQGHDSAGRSVR